MDPVSRPEFERAINNAEKDGTALRGLITEIFDKLDAVSTELNKIDSDNKLLRQHIEDKDFVSKADADNDYMSKSMNFVKNTERFKEQWDRTGKILWFGSWWFKTGIGASIGMYALYQIFGG